MIEKIVCCVDFSKNAKAAFDQALELAEKFQSKLYIVHVLPPVFNPVLPDSEYVFPEQPKESLIIKVEERIQQEYASSVREGLEHEIVVMDGHISSEIIRFVGDEDVDLVILGSYGASGMGRVLFGSVANRVSHNAPCSVMIVRAKGQVP
jgi:nucleotide-binding universal stress UspA family protein